MDQETLTQLSGRLVELCQFIEMAKAFGIACDIPAPHKFEIGGDSLVCPLTMRKGDKKITEKFAVRTSWPFPEFLGMNGPRNFEPISMWVDEANRRLS